MQKEAQDGFNVVELLVVIAIIGILAALLLTTITSVERRTKRIQCLNNVRQLSLALQGFVTDNHAYPLLFNPRWQNNSYPEHRGSWMSALEQGELRGGGNRAHRTAISLVWHCPSAPRPPSLPSELMYVGYGYNGNGLHTATDTNSLGLGGHYVLRGAKDPGFVASPVTASEVANPSEMLAIGDGFTGQTGTLNDQGVEMGRTPASDIMGSTKRAYSRHQGKANVVACDGHVETRTLQFLFQDRSDAALIRWNRDHMPHRERL